MKHTWKCLLLAGVCALLATTDSAAQTSSSSSSFTSFFRPTAGNSARLAAQRQSRADVIQSRRQRATNQTMLSRMGNFIWTFGGLRQVPSSPVTVPRTPRPF